MPTVNPSPGTATLTGAATRLQRGIRPAVGVLTLTGKPPRTPWLDVAGGMLKLIGYPPNLFDFDLEDTFDRVDTSGLGDQWQQTYSGPGASRFVANNRRAHWVVAGDGERTVMNRWKGVNQQETVAVARAGGGTFTLKFQGQETAPIPHDATRTQVQAALEALPNINVGDIEVT